VKAMILAAGLGTRLGPLTNDRPKALVEIAGRTLLQITLARLYEVGIREVIVNVHHFANMVIEYLKDNNNFGMRIEISREEVLLDTGGGIKKAAWFFLEEPETPFLVHNVDVISTIDLRQMVEYHKTNHALGTVAVQKRKTSRNLLFDDQLLLCGRRADKEEIVRPAQQLEPLAFTGIHVISPQLFSLMSEEGVFSIIPVYLRLAAQNEKIMAFRADEYSWRDMGKAESIEAAEKEAESHHRDTEPRRRAPQPENLTTDDTDRTDQH
jgi:NDP-sugar pyrophosphorylase family protein